MKKINAQSGFTILALSLFVFASCRHPFDPPRMEQQQGHGSFSVYLDGQNVSSRTIQPDRQLQVSDFAAYDFAFYAVLSSTEDRLMFTAQRDSADFTEPVFLLPGAYNLRVTAYLDSGRTQPAARGELPDLAVVEGQHGTGAIVLQASMDNQGTGTFSWDITFGAGVTGVTLTSIEVTKLPLPGVLQTFALPAMIDSKELDCGQYSVIITLDKADVTSQGITLTTKTIQWRETLHVYSSMESKYAQEFTADFFVKQNHIVTFEDGSGGIADLFSVLHYNTVAQPSAPAGPAFTTVEGLYLGPAPYNYAFDGWRKSGESTAYNFGAPVITDITIEAQWKSPVIDLTGAAGANIVEKAVAYVNANAAAGREYTLYLENGYSVGAQTIDRTLARLSIIGLGGERTIQYTSATGAGNLFAVTGSSASLTLGNGITLKGINNATSNLVSILGTTFTMENGSKITGHTTSNSNGAVSVGISSSSRFVMNGGTISGNASTSTSTTATGGVYIQPTAQFTMKGGSISGNTSNGIANDVYIVHNAGTATLSDGAAIGSVRLNADSATVYSSLTLDNWTGSATLDLRVQANTANINTGIGYWVGNEVLKAASGSLFAADIAKFTLGNFFSNTAGHTGQAIADTHRIENSGADIGKLVEALYAVTVNDGTTTTGYDDLTAALAAITAAGNYTVTITEDQTLGARTINTANLNITLTAPSPVTIQYNGAANARMFTVNAATASLTLGSGITLKGIAGATSNVVQVSNGTFTMENGSAITGHTTSNANGVMSLAGANTRFVMNGGSISGNAYTGTATAASGGVYVSTYAQFTMNGGTISGNTANAIACDVYVNFDADVRTATLSGAAVVGAIRLSANTANVCSSLTLDNWTGAATLDLRGNDTNINDVIGWWVGKEVLKGAGGALSAADIGRFTLGNFFSSTAGHTGQAIATTHEIVLEGGGGGVLRAK